MTHQQSLDFPRDTYGLGVWRAPPGRFRRMFRGAVHYLSHRFILNRQSTRTVRAGGVRLLVRATVFHPKLFLTSEFFAKFIGTLELTGKRVADVGTGSGILALAAARSGSHEVYAIDINPNAVKAAADNARANGLGDRVIAVQSNLMSGLPADLSFDVITSNPPSFPGEPRDIADRAWVAGPDYRDILSLFEQARQRLKPDGRMYVLLSSDSDLHLLGDLIAKAGFSARVVTALSILVESMIIYELVPS
jgi:methylase of polypeptide subunit release factors